MTSKRQKRAGYPLPATIDTNDTTSYCITIPDTQEYRGAFFGAIFSLTKWWNWEKSYTPGDERAKQAASLWRETLLTGIQDGCGGEELSLAFRENPLDTCEVQYSVDDGQTWLTMFRKDGCVPPPSVMNWQETNTNITNITTNNTTYQGDILNNAPGWAYQAGITDIALCWAVKQFVDIVCDLRASQLTNNSSLLEIANFAEAVFNGTVGALTGIAGYTGNVPGLIAGSFALALGTVAFEWLDSALSNNKSHYEDDDARDIVACWMFNNIKGNTPQFNLWSTSLDDFAGGNDAENAIVDLMQLTLTDIDTYINYLMTLEDTNTITQYLPVCPCPDRWSHFWDFENVGLEAWQLNGSYGQYIAGVGVETELKLLGNGYTVNAIETIDFLETVPNCDGWEYHSIVDRGHFASNTTARGMYMPPVPNFESNSGVISTGSPGWRHNFALSNLTLAQMFIVSCYTQGVDYGSIIITGMTFHGVGIDPFRHRVTS